MRLIQELRVYRVWKPAWLAGAVGLLFAFIVFPIMKSEVSAQVGSSVPNSQAHTEHALQQHADKTSLIVTEDYIIGPEDVLEITV
jgi:hypothetical protein